MATISKFYLHNAATTNTGTMPGAGDPFIIQVGGSVSSDATGDATGARTSRLTNDIIGIAETSATVTFVANTTAQQWGFRRFVSAPLAAQTFSTTDKWTVSLAAAESNTAHNGDVVVEGYCWRPSTGLRVGTGHMSVDFSLTATAKTAFNNSLVSWFTSNVTISDGDILVFEVSNQTSQSMATAYTETFYYDGTTEASTTSCASFVAPPAALTLFGGGTTYTKAGFAEEGVVV